MGAAGSSRTVFEYLDRTPIQKPSGLLQSHDFHGDIEFKNVSLVYPARPDEIAIQVCFLPFLFIGQRSIVLIRIYRSKSMLVKYVLLLDHLDLVS